MLVNQIAVFLENRSGRIADFSRVLREADINIQAMSIADTAEYGVLRAITDNNEKAVKALRANGFNTASADLVGFQVSDKPGEMNKVLTVLDTAGVNISYLYSFARPNKQSAVILVKVDDNEKTGAILKEHGIDLISEGIL
ncbi:MAG: ACT domain-containing protein [Bacillota bacterium]